MCLLTDLLHKVLYQKQKQLVDIKNCGGETRYLSAYSYKTKVGYKFYTVPSSMRKGEKYLQLGNVNIGDRAANNIGTL